MPVSLLLVLGAFAISACSASAKPTTASGAVQASAPILIGIHAFGSPADLNKLEAFATQGGFPSKQMAFPPGSSPSAVATFIERLRGSEFSSLTFKSAYAPPQ